MKNNYNIEAEGSELVLRNSAGDHVIIPKKYRQEVKDMIKDGCFGCIDNIVSTLPVAADYAEDGTLMPEDPPKWAEPTDPLKEKDVEKKPENKRDPNFPTIHVLMESPTDDEAKRDFFKPSAERLRMNLPNVNIIPTYGNKTELDSVLQSVKANDKIVIMGHKGEKTLGILNTDIAASIKQNVKDKSGVECLLGSCNSFDLLEQYKESEVPVYGYNEGSWYVPYDKGKDLFEMMYGWTYEHPELMSGFGDYVPKVIKSPYEKMVSVINKK